MSGHAIKVSRDVYEHIQQLRDGKESYDSCLRRNFGLPSRKGYPQPLREYYVLDTPDSLIVRRTKAEANGEAIMLAVKRGQKLSHKEKKDRVLTVREVPA